MIKNSFGARRSALQAHQPRFFPSRPEISEAPAHASIPIKVGIHACSIARACESTPFLKLVFRMAS